MKYILTQIESDGSTVSHTFNAEYIEDMLTRYLYFLRGCSFVINSHATLEIIKPQLPEDIFDEVKQKTKKNRLR